jgi:CubicO group peptidase (beta-lactamase class C family)
MNGKSHLPMLHRANAVILFALLRVYIYWDFKWERVMSYHRTLRVRKSLISCLAAAGLFLSLHSAAAAQSKIPDDLKAAIERVEALTAAELAKDNLGSVTVGVISGPDLIWAKSFGYADIEGKVPATPDSVYRIGSITKQFTALMLLQLVAQGKVHFTDAVEKYFPDVNKIQGRMPWYPPITLIQLATMTSGIDREPDDLASYLKGPVSEWGNVLVAALPHVKYLYEPDTHYLYSNIGYAMLGAALGHAAGKQYTDYVKENIFAPLQMTHTAFEPNPQIQSNIAKGYDVGPDGKIDANTPAQEHQGRGYKVPNGAIYTTIGDLARFVELELGGGPDSVISMQSLADNLTRTNSSVDDLGSGYGIGVGVARRGDFVFYGHNGSVVGYTAVAFFERHSKTGIVVLRNVSGGKFNIDVLGEQTLEEIAKAKPKAK